MNAKLNAILNWILAIVVLLTANQIFDKGELHWKVVDWTLWALVVVTCVYSKLKNVKFAYLAFTLMQIRLHCKTFQRPNILGIEDEVQKRRLVVGTIHLALITTINTMLIA
jgi:hypothetical protein